MSKVLRCKDVGMDCDFEVHAETEQEIIQKAGEHAKAKHNMPEISEEVLAKVRSVIHEEQR